MRFLIAGLFIAAMAAFAIASNDKLNYPPAKTVDTVFTYAGTKVPDPYNWLENVDSDDTKQWVQSENKLTFDYLNAIPERQRISDRLTKLLNFERFTAPQKEGHRYFFSRNDGLQNQSVLYVSESLNGKPRVLLDPNTLRADGTIALNGIAISQDGRWLAYALSGAGSDWQEWHVRNVDTGKDTADDIKWAKFSGASWTKNATGFFYERFPKPAGNIMKAADYNHEVYFHKLGTSQDQDKLVYRRPDHPDWLFDAHVTDDGHYLVITGVQGTMHEDRVFFARLGGSDSYTWDSDREAYILKTRFTVKDLFPKADASYGSLGNVGNKFYFQCDKNAPNSKVVSIDVNHIDRGLTTVVPEAKETLEGASIVGHRIFCRYLQDAHGQVKIYDLNGVSEGEVNLPGIGTVNGFGGHMKDHETFYSYTSYLSPATIYRYQIPTGTSNVFREPRVNFDPSPYKTAEVFFHSKDGTRIPMFLTYRRDLKLDGSNPTLMYGYGGFDINEAPAFSTSRAIWLEMGGVYADVVLRGGGEYGEAWHKAGMLHNKQHVFDDFIAAGEYLIAKGYTSTPKLAIQGGSNGGLLIGAMVTQRPDLWGATLPAVGVMDMLRFNKFTIGYAWMSEYGNPDTAKDFPYIYKYSPLQNIKPNVKYPPTLVTTADHDDRVFPAHSFKFAATLQADQAGDAPILIRIETRAGHGGGMPTSKQIALVADEWAFLVKNLNMTLPDGF